MEERGKRWRRASQADKGKAMVYYHKTCILSVILMCLPQIIHCGSLSIEINKHGEYLPSYVGKFRHSLLNGR
jgi:hypothetical protein